MTEAIGLDFGTTICSGVRLACITAGSTSTRRRYQRRMRLWADHSVRIAKVVRCLSMWSTTSDATPILVFSFDQ
jgi:hypothetical protein